MKEFGVVKIFLAIQRN